jgi:hypothetical protein
MAQVAFSILLQSFSAGSVEIEKWPKEACVYLYRAKVTFIGHFVEKL